MQSKPRLVIRDGRPVPVSVDPVARARERFGQAFAHQPGSTWRPRSTPLLNDWLATRNREKA